jgi:hypothetical protein
VRTVISLLATRQNIADYERAGLAAIHLPVERDIDGLQEAVEVLRRETRPRGAVAIFENRYPDFAAAICAQHLYEQRGTPVEESLDAAIDAGLLITRETAALVEPSPDWLDWLGEDSRVIRSS